MPKTTEAVEVRTMTLGDTTCGMNTHPSVLLAALARTTMDLPASCWITTTPFLNCREMGFVLQISGAHSRYLNLAFFTHRNSDSLCALRWEGVGHISGGIRPDDVPAEAFPDKWTHTATWGWMEIASPIDWIRMQIETFLSEA